MTHFKVISMRPYCSATLLRHGRLEGLQWFCSHCWQKIPAKTQPSAARLEPESEDRLTTHGWQSDRDLRIPIGLREVLLGREGAPNWVI
jgi:hypothetical protein